MPPSWFRRPGWRRPTITISLPLLGRPVQRFPTAGSTACIFDLVIPTLGRPSLRTLLEALAEGDGPRPARILVVDDRPDEGPPLSVGQGVEVLAGGGGAGPAAARNVGWRASSAPWVVFVDDDVVPTSSWLDDLAADLADAPPGVVAVQGRVTVPLPEGRPPTDWERNVTGLETARWVTADMAVRRPALVEVGGFDERFPRAYREDVDLALRLEAAGGELRMGRRGVLHPVRPASWWISVKLQAGNRDDAFMDARHGPAWRALAPRGRRRRHLATTAAAVVAVAGLGLRRPAVAAAGTAAWLAGTADLAWARIAPGPRNPREVAAMVATSAALPPVATWHWLAGLAERRRRLSRPGPVPQGAAGSTLAADVTA